MREQLWWEGAGQGMGPRLGALKGPRDKTGSKQARSTQTVRCTRWVRTELQTLLGQQSDCHQSHEEEGMDFLLNHHQARARLAHAERSRRRAPSAFPREARKLRDQALPITFISSSPSWWTC